MSLRDTLIAAGMNRAQADLIDTKEVADDTALATKAPIASPTFTGQVAIAAGGTFKADVGTASATAGAATLNTMAGKITTEALTTAAGADYTLTLTNSAIAAADLVFASVANGTNTGGDAVIERITTASGSVTVEIQNHATIAALNGTLVISFLVVKA